MIRRARPLAVGEGSRPLEAGPPPPRFFYGWVVVGAAMLMVASGVGVVQAFAVFLEPLEREFGWSRSALSLAYALNFTVFGASSTLMGALADRYGTRAVAKAAGSVYALGLAMTAGAQSLWSLYLTFGVVAGIGVGALHGPLAYLTAKWFDRRKGLAMGVVLSGTGIGVMLASPLARALMTWGNWRTAFLGLGALALLVILGCGSLLSNTPEDKGQRPYGAAPTGEGEGGEAPGPTWTTALAIRTRSYWVLLGTFFFCCASHSGPALHMAACAAGAGMSPAASTGLLSIFGAFSIAGRIGLGMVADRIGGKPTLLLALLLQTGAAFWVAFTREDWAFYVFAVALGIAFGGVYAQYPVLTRDYFGATKVGAVYGSQMFFSQLGMAVGGLGVGALYDLAGNYRDPFLASAFSGLVALALAPALARPAPPTVGGHGVPGGLEKAG